MRHLMTYPINERATSLARNLGSGEQLISVHALAEALGYDVTIVDNNLRERMASDMASAGVDADFGASSTDVRLRRTAPQSEGGAPDLDELGDLIFWAVALLASFVPAIAYQLVPGGQLEDKQTLFFVVYLTTLPWSGSLTLIFLMYKRKWMDTDQERAWTAAGLLIGSATLGWGFGSTQADLQFLSQVHGNVPTIVLQVVAYIIATYAYIYGIVLWLGGIATGAWAAYWLHRKLPK